MRPAWYSKKWVIVLLHAAAWITLFSLPFLLRRSYNDKQEQNHEEISAARAALMYVCTNAFWIGFFYLNALLLVPRLLNKNKYWQYVSSLLSIFTIIVFIQAALFIYFRNPPHFSISNHVLFN